MSKSSYTLFIVYEPVLPWALGYVGDSDGFKDNSYGSRRGKTDVTINVAGITITDVSSGAKTGDTNTPSSRIKEDLQRYFTNSPVALRGFYDLAGMAANANFMVWLHSESAVELQKTFRYLGTVFYNMRVQWSAMGVHRDAEFNKSHIPSFMCGEKPRLWLTVYPFVRTPEWYLLPADDRKEMLIEHGRKARAFMGVKPNTVAAFSLGNYEWLLPMESDDLVELVDLMRELRYTQARRYMQLETPFYTGRRVEIADLQEILSE